MSSTSLENEDLDNVPLVRMEDVQPSKRSVSRASSKDDEVYETCIIDDIEYENECIVNEDDDSNIGSMVSLQSEDVYDEDSSSQELIIPEVLEEVGTENDEDELEVFVENQQQDNDLADYLENPLEEDELHCLEGSQVEEEASIDFQEHPGNSIEETDHSYTEVRECKMNPNIRVQHMPKTIEVEVPPKEANRVEGLVITPPSESWPTLEILPGGVIKNSEKYESDSYLYPNKVPTSVANTGEMMYACAKCSHTFKYLFCLVKHVKWHEDQTKIMKDPNPGKLNTSSDEYICLHSGKKKIVEAERNKRKASKRSKS